MKETKEKQANSMKENSPSLHGRMALDEQMTDIVDKFFNDYLALQLQASENTISTYRNCIRQFLRYLSNNGQVKICISSFTAENICSFLSDSINSGSINSRSRNHRLAILKSLAKFTLFLYPDLAGSIGRISLIRRQKENRRVLDFLSFDEVECILANAQNKHNHYAILLFLYNTGVRVSELTSLNIGQLSCNSFKTAIIHGKGKKDRPVPLWDETISAIRPLIIDRANQPDSPVFLNHQGHRFSRRGIAHIIKEYIAKSLPSCPELKQKTISPHSFRHTTAMHMLQSGVDLNSIRVVLGHVSINTTNIYIEMDVEMKRKAMEQGKVLLDLPNKKRWDASQKKMNFIEELLKL